MTELMKILLTSKHQSMQETKAEMERIQREQMNKSREFATMVQKQRQSTALPSRVAA